MCVQVWRPEDSFPRSWWAGVTGGCELNSDLCKSSAHLLLCWGALWTTLLRFKKHDQSWAQWYISVIPAFQRLAHEDCQKFQTILGCLRTPCLKIAINKTVTKQTKWKNKCGCTGFPGARVTYLLPSAALSASVLLIAFVYIVLNVASVERWQWRTWVHGAGADSDGTDLLMGRSYQVGANLPRVSFSKAWCRQNILKVPFDPAKLGVLNVCC